MSQRVVELNRGQVSNELYSLLYQPTDLVSGSSYSVGSSVLVGSAGVSGSEVANQVAQDLLALNARNASANVVSVSSVSSSQYSLEASAFSQVEAAILAASNPIELNETEVITVNGQQGVWSNRAEVLNWRGVIPITQYLINEDANPEVIRKRTEQQLIYEQEIAIRYLRPPTPPPPGEIVIRQEKNILTPPAPPLVLRQQPPRPETPPPLVIREAPPRPPAAVGQKVVTISGKRLPPPPRKVVIERLAPLPSKPQSVIIERWLPYRDLKRRVIFQRQTEADPVVPRPRNVIVQWEPPQVVVRKEFRDLGVIRANPVEYVQRYGATLKTHVELPEFVREIRPPVGVVLAAEYVSASLLELEGDVSALNLIDLESNGLAEYRQYLRSLGSSSYSYSGSVSSSSANVNSLLAEVFASVDRDSNGRVSLSEAESLLLRLNSRLGRRYGEDEAKAFVRALDSNRDGSLDLNEFRAAFVRTVA